MRRRSRTEHLAQHADQPQPHESSVKDLPCEFRMSNVFGQVLERM